MAAIITEKFRQHNADQFFESFSEASASTYYLFVGKATAFTSGTTGGSDSSPPTPSDGPTDTEFYAWDSMIAAKNIPSSDITYAIPRRNWSNGTVYDMYDDNISSSNTTTSGASNLYDSSFYFMTSDYRVYKVLDNNDGAAYSGAEPTSTSTSPFALGGYILKYMYQVTSSEAAKFLTSDFIPVSNDSTVSAAATDGKIESLKVTAGSGYTNGTYYAAVYGDGTSAGTSSGAIVRITVSGGAIASFGLTAGSDTTIHAGGAGYTFGTVNLGAGFTFSDSGLSSASNMGGSGGAIEVVISPKNGHGNDAIGELGGHYVMTATTLSQAEGDDITTVNDFRQVGIVVDPTNYGTSTVATASTRRQTFVVKASSSSGTFEVDEKITQATTGAVGFVVDFNSTTKVLRYVQPQFADQGVDSDGNLTAFASTHTVTGATSSATGTPSSHDTTPELTHDTGDILYIENRKPISRAADQTENVKLIVEF